MATPASFSGTLNLPGGPGLPNDPLPMNGSLSFDHQAEFIYKLTGAGTKVVDLGSIPAAGAKALLITVDSTVGAASVEARINGSATGGIQISPGGFVAVCNPNPVLGLTSLSIVYTADVTVRVWVLG